MEIVWLLIAAALIVGATVCWLIWRLRALEREQAEADAWRARLVRMRSGR